MTNTIFKKIYINDYIIDTKLLNKSIKDLLFNQLSNKIYKNKNIHSKISNIVNIFDTLYKEDSNNNKIFNLSYQPYNQYNITFNYYRNYFNKKWIIPVIEEQKKLFINSYDINFKTNKINKIYLPLSDTIVNSDGLIKYYDVNTKKDITYSNYNLFLDENQIQTQLFNKTNLNSAPWKGTEVYVLKNFNMYNNLSTQYSIQSLNDTSIIKKNFSELEQSYYLETITSKTGNIITYSKSIENSIHQLRNILQNDKINITHFLVLNPIHLLTSNYNIFLGNCMSYLNEIINSTHISIDSIIKQPDNSKFIYVPKQQFYDNYANSSNSFILNYLNIIKTYKNFNDTTTIRQLKLIYSIYGYDLNKIPDCYINHLKSVLDNNIRDYIINNTVTNDNFILKYNQYLQNNPSNINNMITTINNLYNNQQNDYTNPNELLNSTPDNGLLFYISQYYEYLQSIQKTQLKSVKYTISDSLSCNYNIAQYHLSLDNFYNTLNLYNPTFYQLNYTNSVYLILYDDIINKIYNNSNKFNIIYESKYINNKPTNPKEVILNTETINLLFSNINYIYSLLHHNSDYDTLFTKLTHYKYLSQFYVLFPIQQLNSFSLIKVKNDLYTFDKSTNKLNPFNISKTKCIFNQYSNNIINYDNLLNKYNNEYFTDLNKYYENLNSIDFDNYNQSILDKITLYTSNNNFYNFLLNKPKSISEINIDNISLQPIQYTLHNNQNISNNIQEYLLNYNIDSITKSTYNSSELYKILVNSDFNTKYTNNINNLGNQLKSISYTPIAKYLNDFELLEVISDNSSSYNRAYYKIIELLIDNEQIKSNNFKLLSLAEAPGNFVRYIKKHIQLKNPNWNNYDIITLLTHDELISQQNFLTEFESNIYKPNESYIGDLTDSKNINLYVEQNLNNKAHLITADGGLDKTHDIDFKLEELQHFPLFLGESITAILNQKKGGTFILKIFNIIDINTINLLYLLSAFYKTVTIKKPYTSRPHNSEKYIICTNFLGIPKKKFNSIKNNLYIILDNIKSLSSNTWPSFSKSPITYFNIFENLNYDEVFNKDIIQYNNSLIIQTQSFYLQNILQILKNKNFHSKHLIDKYYNKNSYNNLSTLFIDNNPDIGYFINKINLSIKLCNYLNIPIKNYINNINSLLKSQKKCIKNPLCNLYPPHFKIKFDIDNSSDQLSTTSKIIDFVNKYCIYFNLDNLDSVLHYKLTKVIESFLLNPLIINIKHIIIDKIQQNKHNINLLYPILIEICKISTLETIFYKYSQQVHSIIINFQNNLRNLLGYYLCKYTYIPLYPKYKTIDDPIQQTELYGILHNSHYICYFSGDKLDNQEFDDFMGNTLYRSNNSSIFDSDSNINSILFNSLNLSWNPEIYDLKHNISLFIINQFTTQFTTDNITNNQKINIIKNFTNIDFNLNNSLITNNQLTTYLNYIYDTISIKEFQEQNNTKDKLKKIHPINTFLKSDTLLEIFKLNDSNSILNEIYDSIILPKINTYATNTNDDSNINNYSIPKYKIKKKNSEEINLEIKSIIDDLYLIFLIQNYIETEYKNIIFYIISSLFYHYYDFDTDNFNSNIDTIILFYNNIINKLIHTIFTSHTQHFNNFSQNIKNPYLDTIKIDSIKTNIFSNNKTLNNHLNKYWNAIYKTPQHIDDFNKTYKNINVSLFNLLNDDFIPIIKNNLHFNTIKSLHLSKTKNYILTKLNKLNNIIFYNTSNITKNFKYISENIKSKNLFDSTNIENSIKIDREELSNIKIFDNFYYINLKTNKEMQTLHNYKLSNNKFHDAINYLLLYVFEDKDIDNKDISQFYNKKRIFYHKENDQIYCKYTNFTKTQILDKIHKLKREEIINLYINNINYNNNTFNHTYYVNKNNVHIENIIGITSLLNNLIYNIDNKNIKYLYKFIHHFILENDSNDYLKEIHMKLHSDITNFTILFLDDYKTEFINFIKQSKFSNYKSKITQIIDSIKIKDIFLDSLKKLYLSDDSDYYDNIINQLNQKILELQKNMTSFFDINLINNDFTNTYSLILFINQIKKHISYISNIYPDYESNIISLKNNYKYIKKFFDDYSFNSLIRIISNNLFDISTVNKDYILNLQIIFSEILDDLSYNFDDLYSTDSELSSKLIYYKILDLLNNIFNKFNSTTYSFQKPDTFDSKKYWNNNSNNIISISNIFDNEISNISNIDKQINNKIYLQLFTKIITQSISDIMFYSESTDDFNTNVNIDFYNEDDLYNNGGAENQDISVFEDGLYLDTDINEIDEDNYYD